MQWNQPRLTDENGKIQSFVYIGLGMWSESRPIGKKAVTIHEHPVTFYGVGNRPSVLKCNELHGCNVGPDIMLKYAGFFKMPWLYTDLANDFG